ncbi:unnamed protein product, partial [Phaeothamnion confervicola]
RKKTVEYGPPAFPPFLMTLAEAVGGFKLLVAKQGANDAKDTGPAAERIAECIRRVTALLVQDFGPSDDASAKRGDYNAAAALIKRALALDPHDKRLHVVRADVSVRLGDLPAAIGSLRVALRLDGSDAAVRNRLARLLEAQGATCLKGPAAALLCFDEALLL